MSYTTIRGISARASVSRGTFGKLFDGIEHCLTSVVEYTTASLAKVASSTQVREVSRGDRLAHLLVDSLSFLDDEPYLVPACITAGTTGSAIIRNERENYFGLLLTIYHAFWDTQGLASPSLANLDIVAKAVVGVLWCHSTKPYAPYTRLAPDIAELMCTLYADVSAGTEAQRTIAHLVRSEHPSNHFRPSIDVPATVRHASAYRARLSLYHIARNPGVSNRHIARAIGVEHLGQVSTLLARLEQCGLLTKQPGGAGQPNSWRVSQHGARVVLALHHH